MKWFDNWFFENCKKAWNRRNEADDVGIYPSDSNFLRKSGGEGLYANSFQFQVFRADGGFVIQYQSPEDTTNYKQEGSRHKLVLVESDEDLGKKINHIMMHESLLS